MREVQMNVLALASGGAQLAWKTSSPELRRRGGRCEKLQVIKTPAGKVVFGGQFELGFHLVPQAPGSRGTQFSPAVADDGAGLGTGTRHGRSRRSRGARSEKMSADDARALKVMRCADRPCRFRSAKIDYLGTEDVDGTEAKLKVTAERWLARHLADPDHWLEIRVRSQRRRGTQVETVEDYGDYEEVAGGISRSRSRSRTSGRWQPADDDRQG